MQSPEQSPIHPLGAPELVLVSPELSWNELIEEHYGLPADGPLEILRDPTRVDSLKHALRVGVITVAELCVDAGLLYAGDRVFGPDHRGLPNVSRSYKGRTQTQDAAREADDAYRRMHGLYVKGDDDKRTKLGKPLSEAGLDELPNIIIHLLTGDLKWFGKTRQPQAEEMVGKFLINACKELEITPLEVSRQIVSGVFNHIATLNGRVMDEHGMRKFVESSSTPLHRLASKKDRIKATLSKDFRNQTSSIQSTEIPSAKSKIVQGALWVASKRKSTTR